MIGRDPGDLALVMEMSSPFHFVAEGKCPKESSQSPSSYTSSLPEGTSSSDSGEQTLSSTSMLSCSCTDLKTRALEHQKHSRHQWSDDDQWSLSDGGGAANKAEEDRCFVYLIHSPLDAWITALRLHTEHEDESWPGFGPQTYKPLPRSNLEKAVLRNP